MSAARFPWLMLRQRLTKSRTQSVTDVPTTGLIGRKEPHSLLGFLGLRTTRQPFSSTSLSDFSNEWNEWDRNEWDRHVYGCYCPRWRPTSLSSVREGSGSQLIGRRGGLAGKLRALEQ